MLDQKSIVLVLALICTLANMVLPRCWADSMNDYSSVVDRVTTLNESMYARVVQIGKSAKGEPILAIVITNPEMLKKYDKRVNVFIMAGQHGDEKTAVGSMLDLASSLANTTNSRYASLLDRVSIVIVPVVNPDGYTVDRRMNANGADLNRDWGRFTQPETRSVMKTIDFLKPHVVIDLHEWTECMPSRTNCIEAPRFGSNDNQKLARILASEHYSTGDCVFSRILYHAECNNTLSHRYLSKKGICSILVETSASRNQSVRCVAYQKLVMSIMYGLAYPDQRTMPLINSIKRTSQGMDDPIIALFDKGPLGTPFAASTVLVLSFIALCGMLSGFAYMRSRDKRDIAPTWMQLKRSNMNGLSLTDAVELNVSTGRKLEMFRECRRRPTNRPKIDERLDHFRSKRAANRSLSSGHR